MWRAFTTTPAGTLAPVMKSWLTPVPSRLALPMVLPTVPVRFAQKMWWAFTATPAVSLAPVMKLRLTSEPSRLASAIVSLLAQKMWRAFTAIPAGWLAPVIKVWLTPAHSRNGPEHDHRYPGHHHGSAHQTPH